jgi:plastocyanin
MRATPLKLLVGAVLSVSACSDHTGPNGGNGDDPPTATANVSVQDNQFVRSSVRVLVGGTVTWAWQGGNQHNVTFTGGPASATQTDGEFERTFATAGAFTYTCTVHGQSMSGTVTVVEPVATESASGAGSGSGY